MKRYLPLLLLLVFSDSAFADGTVMRSTAYPATNAITIPDQRALIQFADGTERLVIETRFTGEGTNFCWVVPLPSEPKVEEATTGIFTTLEFVLRPEVVHTRTALFPSFVAILVFIYLLVILKSEAAPVYLVPPIIVGIALAFYSGPFALIILLFVGWAFHRLNGGETTLIGLLFAVLFVSVLSAMLLPALGGAGSASGMNRVSAISHGQVGAFDVTTVASKNPQALFDWLLENGFEAPAGSKAVVEQYVKENWVFAVAKLHRAAANHATNSIHPLSFTFRTAKPVYPMRLTGVEADSLKVDLYVAGSERAAAEHFQVRQCAPIVAKSSSTFLRQANELPLAHPSLTAWLQGSSVITKLSAELNQEQMKQDVSIAWETFSPYRATFYSRTGAATVAGDWASGAVLVVLIAGLLILTFLRQPPTFRHLILLITLGGAVFLGVFLVLPKIDVRVTKGFPGIRTIHQLRIFEKIVTREWEIAKPLTLAEARSVAAKAIAVEKSENLLLGGKIREEDSPGNYVVREGTNGFSFAWFGSDGGEVSDR